MNIGTPLRPDIFNAATRKTLADDFAAAMSTEHSRMGMALQATQSGIFAGVDLHLEPEHRAARKATRRAKTKAQRIARRAGRA